jgi:hypothetical protein
VSRPARDLGSSPCPLTCPPACLPYPALLQATVMLRRLHNDMVGEKVGKLERRRSKRQRILNFFTSWKQKRPQSHEEVAVRPPVPLLSLVIPTPYLWIIELMATLSHRYRPATITSPRKRRLTQAPTYSPTSNQGTYLIMAACLLQKRQSTAVYHHRRRN